MERTARAGAILSAAAIAMSPLHTVSAGAEAASSRRFSGYATGTVLHGEALRAAGFQPGVLEHGLAMSAASVDSDGLHRPIADEMGQVVQPAAGATKKSYARSAGVNARLLEATPLGVSLGSGLAEAAAPPSSPSQAQNGPVAGAVAQPVWAPRPCVIGQPVSFATASVPAVDAPFVAVGRLFQSRSLTYLEPTADGGFSLVSETRQTFAPLRLLPGSPNEVVVELLGEWLLRATATGRPNGARVEYGPVDRTPDTSVLRLTIDGQTLALTFQDLVGQRGVALNALPLLEIAVGEHPRSIAGRGRPDPAGAPSVALDGTLAAAAVDVLRVTVLAPTPVGGFRTLSLRLGHMEVSAAAPPGGVSCPLPVSKTGTPALVTPGEPFTWTISIPSTADAVGGLSCDLVNLRAVDRTRAAPGVTYTLRSASDGGVLEGPNVTWANLGRYHPGDPPIVLTVHGQSSPDSARGVLADTVEVSADLADCTGGAAGRMFPAAPKQTATIRGRFTLTGPLVVSKDQRPATSR